MDQNAVHCSKDGHLLRGLLEETIETQATRPNSTGSSSAPDVDRLRTMHAANGSC